MLMIAKRDKHSKSKSRTKDDVILKPKTVNEYFSKFLYIDAVKTV